MPVDLKIRIGIINISDRASQGIYEDIPGKEIVKTLSEYIKGDWEKEYAIIPDEQALIEQMLINMADEKNCCLVVTCGGTGPSPRDVTPEATEKVCHKMMPGFGELMRSVSLKYVPTAILSRQMAGIRNKTLIVNLPGKPKAIQQCLEAIFPAIPYCIDLIGGPFIESNEQVIKVFRPQA
jgi:molybdopterin adenylyltransferase